MIMVTDFIPKFKLEFLSNDHVEMIHETSRLPHFPLNAALNN